MPNEHRWVSLTMEASRGRISLLLGLLLLVVAGAGAIGIYAWQKHERKLQWEAVASSYEKASSPSERLALIERHRDMPQSALWLLQTAAVQFQEGAYSGAARSFRLFLDYFPKHPLRPAALLGAAVGLEAEGKREEAVRSYRAVIDAQAADPYRLVAEIHLARLDIEQKQYAPAKALLESIRQRRPMNRFAGEIEDLQGRLPP